MSSTLRRGTAAVLAAAAAVALGPAGSLGLAGSLAGGGGEGAAGGGQVACDVTVVGAGWAGIYAAWRLATGAAEEDGEPLAVCLVEAYHRPGGRTYSTRLEGYMVDAGAYRFAGDMHLPADLITRELGLRSACYDPTCRDDDVRGEVAWPYQLPLLKIVDFQGRHLGYGAALEALLARFEAAGGTFVTGARLIGLTSAAAPMQRAPLGHEKASPRTTRRWRLAFEGGRELESGAVILNMPRPALRRVKGLEEVLGPERGSAVGCTARAFPPALKEGATTTKVYAIYEDAWWVSKLGLLRGVRENMTTAPTVSIHYHDGEVLCTDGAPDAGGSPGWVPAREAPQRERCRGVLQVFYRHSQSCPAAFPGCMEFWANLRRANFSDPVTVVRAGTAAEGDALLAAVHGKLLAMHADELAAAKIPADSIAGPSTLLYSVWHHEETLPAQDAGLLTGPQDLIYGDAAGGLPAACGGGASASLSAAAWEERVAGSGAWAAEGPAAGLHIVNNDFAATAASRWHGPWSEASLLATERLLKRVFKLQRPRWLNASYYDRNVLGTDPGAAWASGPRSSGAIYA